MSLRGKTALVTGAARRIGRAMALALAGEGVHVVVHYHRSHAEAQALVDEIMGQGVRAQAVRADLADADQAAGLVRRAEDIGGAIDTVINSASIFPAGTLTDLTPEDLAANVQVNATSPFLIGRALAERGREAAIVNFLDARMVDYDSRHAAYHLSKRMLFTLTRMMALEFAPAVRVNAVAPGLILPPPGEDESYLQRLAPTNPLNTAGTLEGITDAVLFLLRSGFITGQVIFVDGGRHLRGNVYGV